MPSLRTKGTLELVHDHVSHIKEKWPAVLEAAFSSPSADRH